MILCRPDHIALRCNAIACHETEQFCINVSDNEIEAWAANRGWRVFDRCGERRHHCEMCAETKTVRRAA